MKRPTALHLFSGCGGISLGFEAGGFETVGVAEIDDAAAATYRKNFRTERPGHFLGTKEGDIRRLDFRFWLRGSKGAKAPRLDLVTGGSPCQAFSRVGRGKLNSVAGSFVEDHRNKLWREFFRAVEVLRPRAFLFENVPGMLHHGGRNMAEEVCVAGIELGYNVRCAVINAAGYGVPQTRERLFILGVEDPDCSPTFPIGNNIVTPTTTLGAHVSSDDVFERRDLFAGYVGPRDLESCVSAKAALGDLPIFNGHLKEDYSSKSPPVAQRYRPVRPSEYAVRMRKWRGLPRPEVVDDHFIKATPRDYETFKKMREGDKYPEALEIAEMRYRQACKRWKVTGGHRPRRAEFIPPYRNDVFPEKWRKLVASLPSWTVTAHLAKDVYSHIHYDGAQARTITIREAARLQSFPDGFVFCGNVGDRFRQIGNAVPPLLALALAKHIRMLLKQAS